jgi:hypothetical protein
MAEESPLVREALGPQGHKSTNWLEVSSGNRFKNTGDEIVIDLYPADDHQLDLAVIWVKHVPYPEPKTVMSLGLACVESAQGRVRVNRRYHLDESGALNLGVILEDLEGGTQGDYDYGDIGVVGRQALLNELKNFGPIV